MLSLKHRDEFGFTESLRWWCIASLRF